MKKLLTVLTVLTTIISYNSLYSQDKPVQEHLTFMGIPINGKLSDFVEKMKSEGFATDTTDTKTDVVTMKGEFVGENVNIQIDATPKSKTVYQVIVVSPERKDWSLLEQDYKKYKGMLSRKYGKPVINNAVFENKNIKSNSSKLEAVKDGKCNFSTMWILSLSRDRIETSINRDKTTCIIYTDATNEDLKYREDEE